MNEKIQKNLQNSLFALAVLYVIVLVLHIMAYKAIDFVFIEEAIITITLFFGYIKAKNGEKIAGIIGMVIGILMMLTIINLDIIDFLLGLILLIHSFKYSKEFN